MPDHVHDPAKTREHWAARAGLLVIGGVAAAVALNAFFQTRVAGDEAALITGTYLYGATFEGRRIGAYRLENFADVYTHGPREGPEALWLGNSQMHAINQGDEHDHGAAFYASAELGWPTWSLSLPNASLQEHLIVLHWALGRRDPDWLILPLVFDDLREDRVRPGMERLGDPAVVSALSGSEIGASLARKLGGDLRSGATPGQPVEATHRSFQQITEERLEAILSTISTLWAGRVETLVAVKLAIYHFRNWIFRIDSSSQRRMIPLRYERNMLAFDEILDVARARDLPVLVYVVPLRWDIEPPYDLDSYRVWKAEVEAIATDRGAVFADLDDIVPGSHWGTIDTGDREYLDFMHFQDGGHRRLGKAVAGLLRREDGKRGSPAP